MNIRLCTTPVLVNYSIGAAALAVDDGSSVCASSLRRYIGLPAFTDVQLAFIITLDHTHRPHTHTHTHSRLPRASSVTQSENVFGYFSISLPSAEGAHPMRIVTRLKTYSPAVASRAAKSYFIDY